MNVGGFAKCGCCLHVSGTTARGERAAGLQDEVETWDVTRQQLAEGKGKEAVLLIVDGRRSGSLMWL